MDALDDAGFEEPTPIQSQAIPLLLRGGDLVGVAETGTGKTAAFLLPILNGMEAGSQDPQALVICPTRELAMQVAGEARRFGASIGARTVLAYGGTSSGQQKADLKEGCDILVGTPGRLLDFVQSAWLSLRKLKHLVLDEADRMLDMGFINDVDAILRKTPMSRQTMLFSATFPDEIAELAGRYLLHPEKVTTHRRTRVTSNVNHAFYPVSKNEKEALLFEILRREKPQKTLIFTATREATSELGTSLRRKRYDVISLSSLLSQANRERALEAFRKGECQMLVATDVAARGIDITDIDLVVNFDVPMHPEDYVHRIGRTGRAERSGKAVTLVCELDGRRTGDIERLLGEPIPRIKLDGFDYRKWPVESGGSRRSRPGGRRRSGKRRPAGGAAGKGSGTGGRRRRRRGGKS
ncbi:MAG: DEAD/DEAH box helicase [Acidobacteria bacterium]|nr:DEAD/DEAH box helicase [Acidobacteriota bacterium]NIM64255.1 DEAD/DEAH box helicase [Acidobacteriota bacterium]NIO59253.1 DEAD/DEAH box helicase [Acidobacteriota bacterium]NIQ30280.1 DEAD/DEAH box helicase [Acidobacteriota bacterium]NIQ85208.1 DEAD/DEAH box helicase [Acidobacteriota bacterium]